MKSDGNGNWIIKKANMMVILILSVSSFAFGIGSVVQKSKTEYEVASLIEKVEINHNLVEGMNLCQSEIQKDFAVMNEKIKNIEGNVDKIEKKMK